MLGLICACVGAVVGIAAVVNHSIKNERRKQRVFETKMDQELESLKHAEIHKKKKIITRLKNEAQTNCDQNFNNRNNCQKTIDRLKAKLKSEGFITQNLRRTLGASINSWEEKRDFFNRSISFWLTKKNRLNGALSKLDKGDDINIEALKSNRFADRYPVRGELYVLSKSELKDRRVPIIDNITGNIEDWEYKDRVLPVNGKYPALLRYFDSDSKEPYYSLTAGQLKYLWLHNTNTFEAEVVRIDEKERIICRYLGLENIILPRNGLFNKSKEPQPGEKFTAHVWEYDRYLNNIIVGQFDKQETYQNSFNTIYFRHDKNYDFMDKFNNDHKQRFLVSFTDDKIYLTASKIKYYVEIKLNEEIGAFEILSRIHKTKKTGNGDNDEYVIQRKFQWLKDADLHGDVENRIYEMASIEKEVEKERERRDIVGKMEYARDSFSVHSDYLDACDYKFYDEIAVPVKTVNIKVIDNQVVISLAPGELSRLIAEVKEKLNIDIFIKNYYKITLSHIDCRIIYIDYEKETITLKPVEAQALPARLSNPVMRPVVNVQINRQKMALSRFMSGNIVNPDLQIAIMSSNSTVDYKQLGLTGINPKFNSTQRQAIIGALSTPDLYLVQGPPGTGKTACVAEMVEHFLKLHPNKNLRILVTSQSHVAVDNALVKIMDQAVGKNLVKRSDVVRFTSQYAEKKIDKKLKDISCTEYKKSDHTIIGCTSSLVGGLGYERLGEIDLVIFDEAGRCTLPETLAPLICAKKLVLVGDHKQLPPVVDRDVIDTGFSEDKRAVNQTIKTSLFEELIEKLPANRKTMLDTQYRMDKKIGNIVSDLFYDGQLKTGKKDGNSAPASSIKWFSVNDAKHKRCADTKSLSNYKEALKIMKYLNSLAFGETFIEKQIVVITPYTSQLKMLQQLWQHRNNTRARINLNVTFTTIDAYQGQEADVIIYSAVRTSGSPDFVADCQRLNVAISRARENFILFGHEKTLCQNLSSGETNPFIALRNHFDKVIYV